MQVIGNSHTTSNLWIMTGILFLVLFVIQLDESNKKIKSIFFISFISMIISLYCSLLSVHDTKKVVLISMTYKQLSEQYEIIDKDGVVYDKYIKE